MTYSRKDTRVFSLFQNIQMSLKYRFGTRRTRAATRSKKSVCTMFS